MFIFARKVLHERWREKFGYLFISGAKSQVGSRPPHFWVF